MKRLSIGSKKESKFSILNFFGIRIFMILGLVPILIYSCQTAIQRFDVDVEKPLVEKAINQCIGWAKTKDINSLYGIIANDSNYLEVSPEGKVTKGFEEFRKNEQIWMNPDFKAIRYNITDLTINFSESGETAWFFCMLDDINEWKGQPASWKNTRWTGILEKRDNKWIMVQMHFSFADE